MATQSHLKKFEQTKSTWDGLDFKKVIREDLGTASFKSVQPLIESLGLKITRADRVKESLSDSVLQQFYSRIDDFIGQLKVLISSNEAQFVTQKEQIQNRLLAYNEEILLVWPQIVAIINDTDKSIQVDKTLEELNKIRSKSLDDAKNIQELKESLSAELQSFEERYKNDIFNKAEIIRQEDAFSSDAIGFRRSSRWWLSGVVLSSLALAILLFLVFKKFCFEWVCYDEVLCFNYDLICEGCNESVLYFEIFKSAAYRLFLISFMSFIIGICVKNYNSCMHNFTVNKHKANSLSAALVLLEKAKTDQGNDELMTQAANAIFSHQPTGFSSRSPENVTTTVIDTIVDKVKGK